MRYSAFVSFVCLISCHSSGTNDAVTGPDSLALEQNMLPAPDEPALDSVKFSINSDTTYSYKKALVQLQARRNSWLASYQSQPNKMGQDSILLLAGKDLENTLVQSIFPFWYGTAWDFNGISNVPGEGQIACGYFVSTTLKHAGCNLNRYRVAQQSAKKACEIFALGDSVWRIQPADIDDFKAKASHLKDGLYCIGLDYHVGFLLKREGRYFFIHSSYVGIDGVSLETIEESPAFYSQVYYLSALSTNKKFVKAWLSGNFINHQ